MENIQLVIFDWAGTTVDYGCIAPLDVFQKVFADKQIDLSLEEVCKPMGMGKKDHIRTLLQTENATKQWFEVYGRNWNEDDVEELFQNFNQTLLKNLHQYCKPIDGVLETIDVLRKCGVKIGSTTGYTKEMMDIVVPGAKKLGYEPDYLVTSEMVGTGRPHPFMIYENMRHFDVFPPRCVIKVGDTAADINEGKNAGVWSVGIIKGSSASQMTPEMEKNLSEAEKEIYYKKAIKVFKEAGADFIIHSIKELPQLIDQINIMLQKGNNNGKIL